MHIIDEQLRFYQMKKAGCTFVSVVAHNPIKYGWHHLIVNEITVNNIDNIISSFINNIEVSTVSLIFPTVVEEQDFISLIHILESCSMIYLEQDIIEDNHRCLGFRVKVFDKKSWVSGFANFNFLPKTRQSPYCEITFRVKKRPNYEKYMKTPPDGVLHLADMDMQGMDEDAFKKLWQSSLDNTKKVLGHSPNIHSAAKTTFSIPLKLFK